MERKKEKEIKRKLKGSYKEVKGKLKGQMLCFPEGQLLCFPTFLQGQEYCPFNFQVVADHDNFPLTSL